MHLMEMSMGLYVFPTLYSFLQGTLIICEGLAGKSKRLLVQVVSTADSHGHGVVAKEAITKRSYVCEYKTSKVYPTSAYDNLREMNSASS